MLKVTKRVWQYYDCWKVFGVPYEWLVLLFDFLLFYKSIKSLILNLIFFCSRIHDRKLCILGLCTIISLGDGRPPVLNEMAARIIPAFTLLFDGLKRAYAMRASDGDDDEDSELDDDDDDCDGKFFFLFF